MLLLAVFACLVMAQAIGVLSLRQRRAEGLAAAVVFILALAALAIAFQALGFRV